MHDDRISSDRSGEGRAPTDQEDAAWQARVLALVLEQDPHQLSKQEAARELLGSQPSWEEQDSLERAVIGLEAAGLLRRCETLLLLTRAARHFASLELD
jgi:hypothetical protein